MNLAHLAIKVVLVVLSARMTLATNLAGPSDGMGLDSYGNLEPKGIINQFMCRLFVNSVGLGHGEQTLNYDIIPDNSPARTGTYRIQILSLRVYLILPKVDSIDYYTYTQMVKSIISSIEVCQLVIPRIAVSWPKESFMAAFTILNTVKATMIHIQERIPKRQSLSTRPFNNMYEEITELRTKFRWDPPRVDRLILSAKTFILIKMLDHLYDHMTLKSFKIVIYYHHLGARHDNEAITIHKHPYHLIFPQSYYRRNSPDIPLILMPGVLALGLDVYKEQVAPNTFHCQLFAIDIDADCLAIFKIGTNSTDQQISPIFGLLKSVCLILIQIGPTTVRLKFPDSNIQNVECPPLSTVANFLNCIYIPGTTFALFKFQPAQNTSTSLNSDPTITTIFPSIWLECCQSDALIYIVNNLAPSTFLNVYLTPSSYPQQLSDLLTTLKPTSPPRVFIQLNILKYILSQLNTNNLSSQSQALNNYYPYLINHTPSIQNESCYNIIDLCNILVSLYYKSRSDKSYIYHQLLLHLENPPNTQVSFLICPFVHTFANHPKGLLVSQVLFGQQTLNTRYIDLRVEHYYHGASAVIINHIQELLTHSEYFLPNEQLLTSLRSVYLYFQHVPYQSNALALLFTFIDFVCRFNYPNLTIYIFYRYLYPELTQSIIEHIAKKYNRTTPTHNSKLVFYLNLAQTQVKVPSTNYHVLTYDDFNHFPKGIFYKLNCHNFLLFVATPPAYTTTTTTTTPQPNCFNYPPPPIQPNNHLPTPNYSTRPPAPNHSTRPPAPNRPLALIQPNNFLPTPNRPPPPNYPPPPIQPNNLLPTPNRPPAPNYFNPPLNTPPPKHPSTPTRPNTNHPPNHTYPNTSPAQPNPPQ
ncbi:hypothetical protein NEHOM01_0475 [Nematocida homosporus]|uniref:uncharacterized protein n=1 Tax=Nematocida homosporus TaxID=1912981 RepID=UPI00221F59C7|nr:uncharacterized protein NEHOM01_0475 [Nematocida homosporus]KAI5184924.1 hypothetical protein NEHOM01_0475 [Nematocida homosporus]